MKSRLLEMYELLCEEQVKFDNGFYNVLEEPEIQYPLYFETKKQKDILGNILKTLEDLNVKWLKTNFCTPYRSLIIIQLKDIEKFKNFFKGYDPRKKFYNLRKRIKK